MVLLLLACGLDNSLKGEGTDPPPFDSGTTPTPVDTATESDPVGDDTAATCPPLERTEAGRVDIDPDCGLPVPVAGDPWDLVRERILEVDYPGSYALPVVGNLSDDDGDGRIDAGDVPDVAVAAFDTSELVVLSGDGSGELFRVPGVDGLGGLTMADVDGDGSPDVVALGTGNRVLAVDRTGAVMWTSASFPVTREPQPTVADLDGDGDVEVVYDVAVINGADGSTVATLPRSDTSWSTPMLADLDQDGTQEIVLGEGVYDARGNLLWTAPTAWGVFPALVQADTDDEAEVIFAGGPSLALYEADGTEIWTTTLAGSQPGPPCVADFDGDGAAEIGVPAGQVFSMVELDGSTRWTAPMYDASGVAGCSGWDMDADGAWEVLFADEGSFYVWDGRTGAVRYEDTDHRSGTGYEYPVVADVDHDGAAEILVARTNGASPDGVAVYGHATGEWPRSGISWGTHDFALTNLDPDLGVPASPEPSWLAWNLFRARPPVDDGELADLVPVITDACVADCARGPVRIALGVENRGPRDVEAGVELRVEALDADGAREVARVVLPALDAGERLPGWEQELTAADVGELGWRVTVDPTGAVEQCDVDNDVVEWREVYCP